MDSGWWLRNVVAGGGWKDSRVAVGTRKDCAAVLRKELTRKVNTTLWVS